MKIAVGIETKVRELDGWLWLAVNLLVKKSGSIFYIGDKGEIRSKINLIKPDFFIDKNFNLQIAGKAQKENFRYSFLHAEGGVYPSPEYFINLKCKNKDKFNLAYRIFVWGKFGEETYLRIPSVSKTQIALTGTPYFDMHKSELRKVNAQEVKNLNSKYGNFLLIPTAFTFANHYFKSPGQRIRETPKKWQFRISHQVKLFPKFLRLIEMIASHFKDISIIIRKHPSESISHYQCLAEKYPNIVCVNEGGILPWILASGLVIHDSKCTTGIDAAFLGKPRVTYCPIEQKGYQLPQVLHCTNRAKSEKEVVKYIEKNFGKDRSMTEKQKELIKPYINNVDDYAVDKIINNFVFSEDFNDKERSLSRHSFALNILKIKIRKLRKSLLETRAYKNRKIKYVRNKRGWIREDEIRLKIESLMGVAAERLEVPPKKMLVEKVSSSKQCFKIWEERS